MFGKEFWPETGGASWTLSAWWVEEGGGLGEWVSEETGGEERRRKPCGAVGEGAMGAMKVGVGREDGGGGEADD